MSQQNGFEDISLLFSDRNDVVYFIEDKTTHEWITDAKEWTNEPTEALTFHNYYKAFTWAMNNDIENFMITEHLFIDNNN